MLASLYFFPPTLIPERTVWLGPLGKRDAAEKNLNMKAKGASPQQPVLVGGDHCASCDSRQSTLCHSLGEMAAYVTVMRSYLV